MNPTVTLTIVALKMYFRNRQAIFWTMFLPLLLMLIFGLINFGEFSRIDMGVVDQAQNPVSRDLIEALRDSDVLEITVGSQGEELEALEDGDRDIVIILPAALGEIGTVANVQSFHAEGSQQEAEIGSSIVRGILDDMTFRLTETAQLFAFESQVHVDNFHGGVSGTYRCYADGWVIISEAGRVSQIMPGSPESLSGLLVYPIDRVRSGSAMSKEPVDFPLGAADPVRNMPSSVDSPVHFDEEGKLVVGWAICRVLPVGDWDVRLPR